MTNLEDIRNRIAPELDQLNAQISAALSSSNPLMERIVTTYLKKKGKQIRPILVVLAAKIFGEVNPAVIAAGASVELLHNASLIHDDVVDETKLRRGVETVNGRWDNHIAVLVGDFFVSTSLAQALLTNDIRIIGAIASLGQQLSVGELDQIYNARFHTLSEEAYMQTIYRKTASLFVSCVQMGAFAVGASNTDIVKISEAARMLGLCFQIRDDIFDYYSAEAIGKPTGNDLREGKITLPLLHVLLDETLPAHAEMVALSRKEELSAAEIDVLIEYAKNNGGIDYAYKVMEDLRDQALRILDTLPDCEARRSMAEIICYVVDRDN